jgi:flagellar biosynthesis protein FlhF
MARVNLKTFRAKSMADALAAVKKDLGKDALILHTRNYRSGGI